MITEQIILQGYKHLKSFAYFESLNIYLKKRVATFEFRNGTNDFEGLAETLFNGDWEDNEKLNSLLKKVNFRLIPKDITDINENDNKPFSNFITNNLDSDSYKVNKVNYFFDAPAELWLIDMLWTLIVGPIFDKSLSKDCYGNRLKKNLFKDSCGNFETFNSYIHQYNCWRTGAVETAKQIAGSGENVAILALDIQQYYYNVNLDFEQIESEILRVLQDQSSESELEIALYLTRLLQKVYAAYHKKVTNKFKRTHPDSKSQQCLPIGLTSSAVFANWYLAEFDNMVHEQVRPAYYGRYVDDLIFTFRRPVLKSDDTLNQFIKTYFGDSLYIEGELLKLDINDSSFTIHTENKMQFHYFSADHSLAGLDSVTEALRQQSSEFRLLPDADAEISMSAFAKEFIYDGNEQQLKSILNATESEGSLSLFISKKISKSQTISEHDSLPILQDIVKFFKGKNVFRFFRLWEKVYQLAIVLKQYNVAAEFYENLRKEISHIDATNIGNERIQKSYVTRIRKDLNLYNDFALSGVIAVLDIKDPKSTFPIIMTESSPFHTAKAKLCRVTKKHNLESLAYKMRSANLFKHNLVAWPLVNYTNFIGDLTCKHSILNSNETGISNEKVQLSPRYIHFDEWQVFKLYNQLKNKEDLGNWLDTIVNEYSECTGNHISDCEVNIESNEHSAIAIRHLKVGKKTHTDSLKVALANFIVNESDIVAALRKDQNINLSEERQNKLNGMLNSALKEQVDLVVFPEVSIPISWLPSVVHFARTNQIGLIFGLEHWVVDDIAYNLTIEVLPYLSGDNYKSCMVIPRLKNHYSPEEKKLIGSLRLQQPSGQKTSYHRNSWRGVSFSTYNCFELSDITHRVLFKSKLDLLIACVFNRDTNYYQHILESTVRDLHCYTIQSNTSQYGGSCILRPSKTESKVLLYVKGGDNSSILSSNLDIAGLRKFHYQATSISSDKNYFKPLPPGFNHDGLAER